MPDPRYPIGPFVPDARPTPESRARHIESISGQPALFRQAVAGLNGEQLDTPYR